MKKERFQGANYRLPQPGIDFMTTRCKFRCESRTETPDSRSYNFSAVTGGSDENKSFWKYTPSGTLQLNCVNEKVEFTPGKEYYIDITSAE